MSISLDARNPDYAAAARRGGKEGHKSVNEDIVSE